MEVGVGVGEEEGEDVGGGEKGGLSQSFPQKAGYSPAPPSDGEVRLGALGSGEDDKGVGHGWAWRKVLRQEAPRGTRHRTVTKEVRPAET